MKFKSIFLILLLLAAITACSKEEEKSINAYVYITPASTSTALQSTPKLEPTPITTTSPTPTLKPITLSFGGDVMFETHVKDTFDNKGLDYLIEDIAPIFKKSDISMVNLETPISFNGEKEKDKQFTFRSDPKYLDILSSSGINVVSLANNHSLDYGILALEDTFKHLKEKNISYIGAGRNMSEASQPLYINRNDTKVALLGSSRVVPFVTWHAGDKKTGVATTYDPTIINTQIKKAKANSDFVVCYIHWGEEGKIHPVENQKKLAYNYIDNGADIVIGSHPHILQGIESYKGKLIVYSLGNLIFTDMYKKSAILNLKIDKSNILNANVIPMEIINFKPTLIKDSDKSQKFYNELNDLSFGVKIDSEGNILIKK